MKILILDIETTGFSPKKNFIVEIGIVELDLSNGNRKIIFDHVMHEKGITKKEVEESWVVENTTITVDEIRRSKSLDYYKDEIQDIFNLYPLGVTAYNKKFDFGFLSNRDFKFNELPCPMLVSTDVCKIPNKWNNGYKWPNVQEAYDFFFAPHNYIEVHRGGDDAYHEAEIVYELYLRGKFEIN